MKERVPIGSHFQWIAVRLASALFLWVLFEIVLTIRSRPFEGTLLFMLGCVFSPLVMFHPIGTGWADRNGIHIRQYIMMKAFRWDDIEQILWTTGTVFVVLRHGVFLQRKIMFFLPGSNLRQALEEFRGEPIREPDFIRWLVSTPLQQTRPLEVRHLESSEYMHWEQMKALAVIWSAVLVAYLVMKLF
jgi:hypothetical protein